MPLHDWRDDRGWNSLHTVWQNQLLEWVQPRLPAVYRAYLGRGPVPRMAVRRARPADRAAGGHGRRRIDRLARRDPPAADAAAQALTLACYLPVGAEALSVLARLGPHDRLRTLRVADRFMGDAAVERLAPDPAFPRLTHLDLSHCAISDAGAEALAESAWPGRLHRLVLTGNPISDSRAGWLRARFGPALVV